MAGKGDRDRTTDRKAYRENFDGIDWGTKPPQPPRYEPAVVRDETGTRLVHKRVDEIVNVYPKCAHFQGDLAVRSDEEARPCPYCNLLLKNGIPFRILGITAPETGVLAPEMLENDLVRIHGEAFHDLGGSTTTIRWHEPPEGLKESCPECGLPPAEVSAIQTRYSGSSPDGDEYRNGFRCPQGHVWWRP